MEYVLFLYLTCSKTSCCAPYILSWDLQVGVQGLQILKPLTQKDIPSSMLTADAVKEFTNSVGGINLEVGLVLHEDNVDDEKANWEVENLKFSIKQPVIRISYVMWSLSVITGLYNEDFTMQIEAVVTKDEVQYLTFLCKSEIDSMGRITAGILRLLKLEGSVGQSVMNQLGNLGMPPLFLMYPMLFFIDNGVELISLHKRLYRYLGEFM